MPNNILEIYKKLYKTFGHQHWWPGETPLEVIIGAILTQNTNWLNVEKAINNLKNNKYLTPICLKRIPTKKLAQLIRPAGYFNIKAKRLKEFIKFLFTEYNGSVIKMAKERLGILRNKLLKVNGVGPETADSILLYALNKPVFVIDAYTKRILARHNIIKYNAIYHEIQNLFMKNLPRTVKLFNEYHALLVKTGKDYCKKTAKCNTCPINERRFYGINNC